MIRYLSDYCNTTKTNDKLFRYTTIYMIKYDEARYIYIFHIID